MSKYSCKFMMSESEADDILGCEDEKVEESNKGLSSGKRYFDFAIMENISIDCTAYHSVFRGPTAAAKKIKELRIEHPNRKFFMVATSSFWREIPEDYKMLKY